MKQDEISTRMKKWMFVHSDCMVILNVLHNCHFNQTIKMSAIINGRNEWLIELVRHLGAQRNKCRVERWERGMTQTHNIAINYAKYTYFFVNALILIIRHNVDCDGWWKIKIAKWEQFLHLRPNRNAAKATINKCNKTIISVHFAWLFFGIIDDYSDKQKCRK